MFYPFTKQQIVNFIVIQPNELVFWSQEKSGADPQNSQQQSHKIVAEGGLGVKLPTIWRDEKAEVGRVREEKRREDD